MSSCRGNSAKKAIEIARKYTGKTVNGAKKAHLEKYADDAARVRFVKTKCSSCLGTGEVGYSTCEVCDGDGWVYKVEHK